MEGRDLEGANAQEPQSLLLEKRYDELSIELLKVMILKSPYPNNSCLPLYSIPHNFIYPFHIFFPYSMKLFTLFLPFFSSTSL
jgi:hypothetical protein